LAEKFPGGRGATENKTEKYKKRLKNSTIKPLPGGPTEKTKKWQKTPKIALLSLYLPYLYNV